MNKQAKILAVIVTYNPEIGHLKSFLEVLSKQIDSVLIYDNNSLNFKDIASIQFPQKVTIHFSSINKGLPSHYNAAIQHGIENGFDYLLILDQDSSFDDNFLTEYQKYISDDSTCLVPLLIHSNSNYNDAYPEKNNGETEPVSRTINSGTLLNLKALPAQLRFDEDLFIDCVDFDFFEKIRKFGFKVLRVNSAKLHINLGNISRTGPFFLYNYSPFRLEKQTRDRVIFLRKHPISAFSLWLFLFTIFCDTKAVLFERERLRKIKAIAKGFKEGLFFRISSQQHP